MNISVHVICLEMLFVLKCYLKENIICMTMFLYGNVFCRIMLFGRFFLQDNIICMTILFVLKFICMTILGLGEMFECGGEQGSPLAWKCFLYDNVCMICMTLLFVRQCYLYDNVV